MKEFVDIIASSTLKSENALMNLQKVFSIDNKLQSFAHNRIIQQLEYMREIENSDRDPERKKMLIASAAQVLVYWKNIEVSLCITKAGARYQFGDYSECKAWLELAREIENFRISL